MSHILLGVLLDHVTEATVLDTNSLQHIESCPDCRSDLRWLEQLEKLRKFEPPKATVENISMHSRIGTRLRRDIPLLAEGNNILA